MPVAMLLTVLGVLISAVLASIVTVQTGATRRAAQGLHGLDAAQAGLDVAIGHIRAAADGSGNGVLASLPCGPFAGQVGVGGVAGYSVTITYKETPDGAVIPCVPGSGIAQTPSFAYLVALGTDVANGVTRTLQGTYVFATTNANIPGGLIHVARVSGSQDLCLDAGSPTPAVGAALTVQLCTPGSPRQEFAYNPNLTLTLVSSITDAVPLGLCVDGGPVPHGASNTALTFQPCGTVTQPRQQWSLNDGSNFQGTSDGTTLDTHCFNIQSPDVPGSVVILTPGAGGCPGTRIAHSFSPDAEVGAGAAGASSGQLVSFAQFGRCFDVTSRDWEASYMIVWPCKQAPDTSQVSWNQKWTLPATGVAGVIKTKPAATAFFACLQSPLTVGAGSYVTLAQCPAGAPPANQSWTVRGDTGVYATSYTILDNAGNCLCPTDPTAVPADLFGGGYEISKAIMLPCSGSTMQKWNAPPDIVDGTPLKDIAER